MSSNAASAIALTQWWQGFADEELNRLIGTALKQNQTLAAAEANAQQGQVASQRGLLDRHVINDQGVQLGVGRDDGGHGGFIREDVLGGTSGGGLIWSAHDERQPSRSVFRHYFSTT